MSEWPELITEQQNLLQQLQELLANERMALEKRQVEPLIQLIEQKQQLLLQIHTLDQTITQHPDFEILQQKHQEQLDAMNESLKLCQRDNEINGAIIERSLNTTQRLAQLLDQLQNPNAVTYDNKGATRGAPRTGPGLKA